MAWKPKAVVVELVMFGILLVSLLYSSSLRCCGFLLRFQCPLRRALAIAPAVGLACSLARRCAASAGGPPYATMMGERAGSCDANQFLYTLLFMDIKIGLTR